MQTAVASYTIRGARVFNTCIRPAMATLLRCHSARCTVVGVVSECWVKAIFNPQHFSVKCIDTFTRPRKTHSRHGINKFLDFRSIEHKETKQNC